MSNKILSVASALGLLAIAPTESDLFNNAVKAVLAISVTIIAYFLKELIAVSKRNEREIKKQRLVIQRHNIMFKYWLEQAKAELEHRRGDDTLPGRRKSDVALINLFNAIQDTEIEEEDE